MFVKQSSYEELLADYSCHSGALALLRQYRPYLEFIPSMRRPSESIIPVPLPTARVAQAEQGSEIKQPLRRMTRIPCEVALLMCDPDWKVKLGVEVLVFIHRPQEDFSSLLTRWRQSQIWLDQDYEWSMPLRYQHIYGESADKIYPLFVLHPETPDRIQRGLKGAGLPVVTAEQQFAEEEPVPDSDELTAGLGLNEGDVSFGDSSTDLFSE